MKSQLEKFLEKRGDVLLVGYILLGAVALGIFRTLHDENLAFAFKYLSIPILLLSFYVYFFKMSRFRAKEGPIKGPLYTLGCVLLLITISAGYVSVVNAFGPGQRDITIQGRIAELKTEQHRRGKTYNVVLAGKGDRTLTLKVPLAEYNSLAVGQHYSARWKIGSLGMLYRPRISANRDQHPTGSGPGEKKWSCEQAPAR